MSRFHERKTYTRQCIGRKLRGHADWVSVVAAMSHEVNPLDGILVWRCPGYIVRCRTST
jgi:hypothetical protein